MLVNRLIREEVAYVFYSNINHSFPTIPQFAAIISNFTSYTCGLIRTVNCMPSPRFPYRYGARNHKPSPQKYDFLSLKLLTALKSWTGLETLKVDRCEKYYDVRIVDKLVPDKDFIWHSDTLDLARRIRETYPQHAYCYHDSRIRTVTLALSPKPRSEEFEHFLDVDAEWQKCVDYLGTRSTRSGRSQMKEGNPCESVTSDRDEWMCRGDLDITTSPMAAQATALTVPTLDPERSAKHSLVWHAIETLAVGLKAPF